MEQKYQQIQFNLERAEQLLVEIFPHTEDPRIFLGILETLNQITTELIQINQHQNPTEPHTNQNNLPHTSLNQLKIIQNQIQHLLSTHQTCPTEINTKDHIIMYTNEFQNKITINKNDLQTIIIQLKQIINAQNNTQE